MQSMENILTGAVTGDAAGYTLNGFKKAHIKAVFGEISTYTETAPALKHGMERWRKPGLYSSISQLLLMAGACTEERRFNREMFIHAIETAPELPGLNYSYFRDPGAAEKNLIITRGKRSGGENTRFEQPCARVIPLTLSLLLLNSPPAELFMKCLEFCTLFTFDTGTAACSAVFLRLIEIIRENAVENIYGAALRASEEAAEYSSQKTHEIFSSGFNPDYVTNELMRLSNLFKTLINVKDPDRAEKLICGSVNERLKSPVTRGSVNLPAAVFPFSVSIAALTVDHEQAIMTAASQGGAASALASITGAVIAAVHESFSPEPLITGLANRRKILSIIEDITFGRNRKHALIELAAGEPGLTLKEMEEFASRNRKSAKKQTGKPEKTRKQAEDMINRHVVESWTKTDRAKWRKEKSRIEREKDED